MRRLIFFSLFVLLALGLAAAAQAGSSKQTLIENLTVDQQAGQPELSWESGQATSAQLMLTDPDGQSLAVSDSTRARTHRIPLDGLRAGTSYAFTLTVTAGGQQTAAASGRFTTAASSFQAQSVSVSSGVFRVDGSAFFPVLSWAQCAADVPQGLAVGINTFVGTSCQMPDLAAAVQGKAYLMNSLADGVRYQGQLGWFQPDEADGFGIPSSSLPAPPQDLPTLQTLTTHFDPQRMGDLAGVGAHTDYSGYFAHANVFGFDLYPAAELCGKSPAVSTATVFDLQRAMVKAASGKPTYQWIETNDLEHRCPDPVSGALARAEAWLAVAGGADAIGWFTHGWPGGVWQHFSVSADVQRSMAQTDRELQALAPALLSPQLPAVQPAEQQVKFGLRLFDGTVYVIAVNSSSKPAAGAVALPQLNAGAHLRALLGSGGAQVNRRHALSLRLAGYEVRVLAAIPPAAASF